MSMFRRIANLFHQSGVDREIEIARASREAICRNVC